MQHVIDHQDRSISKSKSDGRKNSRTHKHDRTSSSRKQSENGNDDNNAARDDVPIDGQQTEKDQTVFGGTTSPKQADVMEEDVPVDFHRRSHSRSKSATRARGSQNGSGDVQNNEVPFGRWHGENQDGGRTRHKNQNQQNRQNATRTQANRTESQHSGSANVNANQLAHAVAHAVSHSGRAKGGASNSNNNWSNDNIQRENGSEVQNLSERRSKAPPPLPPHPNSPRTTTVRYIKPTDPIEDDIPTLDGRSRTIWKQRPDDVDEEKQNDIGNGETEGQHRNSHSSRPYRRFIPTSKAQGARKNTRHFTAVNEQLQSKKKKNAGSGNETTNSSDGGSSSEGEALRTRRLNRSEYFQFAFFAINFN